jgi:ComF family protein
MQNPFSKTCNACKTRVIAKRVWVATNYDDVAKHVIHELKFNYVRAVALDIARTIALRLPDLPAHMIVVPIPTAVSRVRQRGFDHAKLIAKEVARLKGLTYRDILRRHGKTRQVGASRIERSTQLTNAFWVNTSLSANTFILLLDDVCTTGATIGSAARALRQAGSNNVYAAVFAYKA